MVSANHLIANEDRIRESNDFLDNCPKFHHKMAYKGMQKMYITPTNSEGFRYLGGLYLLTTL